MRRLWLALILSLLIVGVWGPPPVQAQGPPEREFRPSLVDQTGGPRDQLLLTLVADAAVRPGETVALTLSATPLLDAPVLEIYWVLPDGVELVAGTPTEEIDMMAAREVVQSVRSLRFTTPGTHRVAVEVGYTPYEGARYTRSGVLFFMVDEDAPQVSDLDPLAGIDMTAPVAVTNVVRTPFSIAPQSTSATPCFTVSGSLMRIDKPITASGYGADVMVPVVDFYVELREADLVFDDTIDGTYTDENGQFTFPRFCEGDGLFDDTLELYVWFRAATSAARVTDSSWIDEEYTYETGEISTGGGNLTFDMELNATQSAVFNILAAAGAATDFWYLHDVDDSKIGPVQIHWEPGYGDDGSYYRGFWDEITIADDPSDPDEWDDSVIIHEWGHFADDKRGCDGSPGGPHNVTGTYGTDLAFGEGYPDYYQAAVRDWRGDANAGIYLDVPGSGSSLFVDLESLAPAIPRSQRNEFAVAAALWDLYDGGADGQDLVQHGQTPIHSVYTWNEFTNQGFFDSDCDFENYLRAWSDAGQPNDAVTAAAISQNVFDTTLPTVALVRALDTAPDGALGDAVGAQAATAAMSGAPEYRWWNRTSFVVDTSPSMAGAKLNAVKSALTLQANTYGGVPEGTEFDLQTFHAGSTALNTVFENRFFPSTFAGAISGLTTGGSDSGCTVDALRVLAGAADRDTRTDLWLYTDGDAVSASRVNAVSQRLTDRASRASFVLLGGCTTMALASPGVDATALLSGATAPLATTAGTTPAETSEAALAEQQVIQQRREAATWLGTSGFAPAAVEQPSAGIVPYLLTALKTGGQFLYVDAAQLANAADILEAQLTHKAGAGRWSDYVSDVATYRYDSLASYEFAWIDATDGNAWGKPGSGFAPNSALDGPEGRVAALFSLTSPAFSYYGAGQYGAMVYENGYIVIGGNASDEGATPNNTQLPNGATPNFAVYPFWDDLEWDNRIYIDGSLWVAPPGYENHGTIYTKQVGDWTVVQWYGFGLAADVDFGTGNPFQAQEFQVLFHRTTGEIRFQYGDVTGSAAAGATIGIEDRNATAASVQVAYNNSGAIMDNSGYKFVPAPAQPSRTYTVAVDSTMESVGFLLTGYSGSFDPLLVRDPAGTLVSCSDTANVLCLLDLDPAGRKVQYIQVDTNGRTGNWTATVAAGPSGSGTFALTSLGASPLSPESVGDRTRPAGTALAMVVDLGLPADGGTLTGQLRTPGGVPFGSAFTLFDDGAHGDGGAGDGRFGSAALTPAGSGTAYLWLTGAVNGTAFVRVDPTPYVFQPVSYTSLGDVVNTGGTSTLAFSLRNADTADHCYRFEVTVPEGWWYDTLDALPRCVNAGATVTHQIDVRMTSDATNDLPGGTTGTVTVAAIEWEKGEISDSATASVTRRHSAATVEIYLEQPEIRPGGDTAPVRVYAFDEAGTAVADGTVLTLGTTLGSLPATATTVDGMARVTFTSGAAQGLATLTAQSPGGASDTATILIETAPPDELRLEVAPEVLDEATNTASLTATVTDAYGNPVAGALVRIGVEGDGLRGTLSDGSEAMTGTTNGAGQVTAVFQRVAQSGSAGVRAELLSPDGTGGQRVAREDRKIISLGTPHRVFLPLAIRN